MQLLNDLKTSPRSRFVALAFLAAVFGVLLWFAVALRPAGKEGKIFFEVRQGEGFKEVGSGLKDQGLARSALAAKLYFLISGTAWHIQPGVYLFDRSMSLPKIASDLRSGGQQTVKVTIPEGSSVYDIDQIFSDNFILKAGEFVLADKQYEGKLFPDTYDFFLLSKPADVIKKMTDNFNLKAKPVLDKDPKNFDKNLILASLLEREVPGYSDRQIVAGIFLRRLAIGMPLQVDATICYIKESMGAESCYPLESLDFKLKSAYNTYLNKGLPPGPIGNPGLDAISAVMSPIRTNYLFYLSDPLTHKTIFSETLDKQAQNRVQYLNK